MKTLPILLTSSLLICCVTRTAWPQAEGIQIRPQKFSTEQTSRVIVNYAGALQTGVTYRATARGDKLFGLSLVPAPHILEHQAVLLEWANLNDFASLKRHDSRRRQIVFTVVADEPRRMTDRRWNRTVDCWILLVD